MALVDDVIMDAVDRANTFSNMAADATNKIGNARSPVIINVVDRDIPTVWNAVLTHTPDDKTKDPVYKEPTAKTPEMGAIVDFPVIRPVSIPGAPSINTSGLFDLTRPSYNVPEWSEPAPDLHADEMYAEMQALLPPELVAVDMPEITRFDIDAPPGFVLPTYEQPAIPDVIASPVDYAAYMRRMYSQAVPEMQAYIDGTVDAWVAKYAPEMPEQRAAISTKLLDGLDGGVLPDQFENAMFTRAQGRVDAEYITAEEAIWQDSKHRGFIIPPGAVTSAMNNARLAGANALANQATDIYIERRKSEIQHMQFCMGIVDAQIRSVRESAVQVAANTLGVLHQANVYADALTAKLIVAFEHERSRAEFGLALMAALNAQFEVRLKAALSGLEGYKAQLQAYALRTDVEAKVIEATKLQLEAQQLQVVRYSAMVDAIAKRAQVQELKAKEFAVQVDAFKADMQGRIATYEIYKAAIEVDKAKVQGELAKLEAYNAQLKGEELKLQAQSKEVEVKATQNKITLEQYKTEYDVYSTALKTALQKYEADAAIKRMGMDIYKTKLESNLSLYKSDLQKDMVVLESEITKYKTSAEKWIAGLNLEKAYTEIEVQKAIAIATGYSNLGAAAAQSASSNASVAAQG
jgi:hypothetical protein